jgi:hypothetical protein
MNDKTVDDKISISEDLGSRAARRHPRLLDHWPLGSAGSGRDRKRAHS